MDVEAALRGGFHHIGPQHQVNGVGAGDENALPSVEATRAAHVEEALDLFVDAADRLLSPN